jgi:hypothetical protein
MLRRNVVEVSRRPFSAAMSIGLKACEWPINTAGR